MTCKDCIYRAMCYKHEHYGYGDEYDEKPCEMFKNKADFVEVVRCRECKHGHWEQETCHGKCVHYCDLTDLQIEKEHFCSYGERKSI